MGGGEVFGSTSVIFGTGAWESHGRAVDVLVVCYHRHTRKSKGDHTDVGGNHY